MLKVMKDNKGITDGGFLTPCSVERGYKYFGGIFRQHLQCSHFNPEDGGG
jgi:hypothetical protein